MKYTFDKYQGESNYRFILILCDPVKRVYSDFKHSQTSKYFRSLLKNRYNNSMDEFIKVSKSRLFSGNFNYEERFRENSVTTNEFGTESPNFMTSDPEKFRSKVRGILQSKLTSDLSILTNGLYSLHLEEWLKNFPLPEKILIIDGEDLITDLPGIMMKYEKLLNLRPFFRESEFWKDEKGFYCYSGKCLSNSHTKGNTRGTEASNMTVLTPEKISEDPLKTWLTEFYRPWNEKLYKILDHDFAW